MSVLLNTLQLPLQFLCLIICFTPCTCISLGDSSEFSGTLFIVCSEEIGSTVVLVHATFLLFLAFIVGRCFTSSGCSLWSSRAPLFPLSLIFGFLVLLLVFSTFSAGCNLCLVKICDTKHRANQRHLSVYFLRSMVYCHAQAVAAFLWRQRGCNTFRTCWCYELSIPDRPNELML